MLKMVEIARLVSRPCLAPGGGGVIIGARLLAAALALSGLACVVHAGAGAAALPVESATEIGMRTAPLDFAYRVHGDGPSMGIVFDNGRYVFLQPADPALLSSLSVVDEIFQVQRPYLVVRGLPGRFELMTSAEGSARTVIEYVGPVRRAAIPETCVAPTPGMQRVTIPFGTGVLQTEPGGVEYLARMVAIARGARRVTILSQAARADLPITRLRAARLRELLVASGVEPGSIIEQAQPPAAPVVHVEALRETAPCPPAAIAEAASPAPTEQAEPGSDRAGAQDDALRNAPLAVGLEAAASKVQKQTQHVAAAAAPDKRLSFLPNRSVQATLRDYLKPHGVEVEFRSVPLLMVEAFAEVDGEDLREVLRRALARLGLRGEIHGGRLLVVEQAR
jgi:hypothetical protein